MKTVAGAAILLVFALVVAIALFILGVNVYVWNINDIIANGANFWNVFWLLLFGSMLFGGAGAASRG